MGIQEILDNEVKKSRQKMLSKSDQLTIGLILEKLDPILLKQKERIEAGLGEATVYFDFEYLFPDKIDSWRGSYSELALNFTSSDDGDAPLPVTNFHIMVKNSIGCTFGGYKGGYFVMDENTPVWVANYGNSGSTAVIDIVDYGYQVVIITGYREFS